ncbi:MAG: hypothetical protein WCK90_04755 [archaeon]
MTSKELNIPEPGWPLPLGFENASEKVKAIYRSWLREEDRYLSEFHSGYLSLSSLSDKPEQFDHPTYIHIEDEYSLKRILPKADSSLAFIVENNGIIVNLDIAHTLHKQREEYQKNPTKNFRKEFKAMGNMGLEDVANGK